MRLTEYDRDLLLAGLDSYRKAIDSVRASAPDDIKEIMRHNRLASMSLSNKLLEGGEFILPKPGESAHEFQEILPDDDDAEDGEEVEVE